MVCQREFLRFFPGFLNQSGRRDIDTQTESCEIQAAPDTAGPAPIDPACIRRERIWPGARIWQLATESRSLCGAESGVCDLF